MTQNHPKEVANTALQKRLRTFSRVERVFYGAIVLTGISFAVGIIYLQTRNLQLQQDISNLNSQLSEQQTAYDNAKQEVNELSSRDRIEEIAKNAGLTSQQENVKQVD